METPPGFIHLKGLHELPEGPVKVLTPLSGSQFWQAVYVMRAPTGEYRSFVYGAAGKTPEEAWNAKIDQEDQVSRVKSVLWWKIPPEVPECDYYMKLPGLPITEEMYF